ncbi:MAG: ABC transporter substrate-binding protein [Alphaproteobacteria bacterium]|nr:ABC transporter substrate-binding protein [Alphaproteobacteria bacterium]
MKKSLLYLSAFLCAATASHAGVKVGVALDTTGPIASFMPPIEKAANLVLKQVNEQGGFFASGEKLEYIKGDSACDPVAAVDVAKKMVDVNQVVAVFGPGCSGAAIAQAQSVTIPAGVVSISFSATSPMMTSMEKGTDLVFRTVASDAYQGQVIADLAIKNGVKEIAVMYSNDDYNTGISQVFVKSFKEKGGKVTAVQAFDPGKQTYRSEVTTLAKDTKNMALFAYPGNGGIVILRNALETKAFNAFYAGDAMRSDDLAKQLGADALTGLSVVSGTSDKDSEAYVKWLAAAKDVQLSSGENFVANAYDAMFVLALAIEKAGSTDRKKISEALRSIANAPGELIYPGEFKKAKEILAKGGDIQYVGASGAVDFDENGDVKTLYAINTVGKDGQWKMETLK